MTTTTVTVTTEEGAFCRAVTVRGCRSGERIEARPYRARVPEIPEALDPGVRRMTGKVRNRTPILSSCLRKQESSVVALA